MTEVFTCDAVRTPTGRYGGSLSAVRADNLGVVPLKALVVRNPQVDWSVIDNVVFGCASQVGEDNRNMARMSSLLAGLSDNVPGSTINRLYGSGMDVTGIAACATHSDEIVLMIAGGVEGMSHTPFVMGKAASTFSRDVVIYDTTISWRFINPLMKVQYGVDSMPETVENVAIDYKINREDQDRFALRSQASATRAQGDGTLAQEITPVTIPQREGDAIVVDRDEHPRVINMEAFTKLRGVVCPDGTVTVGNASGVNNGARALLLASEVPVKRFGLTPRAYTVGMITAGVPPCVTDIGPAPASQKLLRQLGLSIDQMDIIKLSEALAAQGLAATCRLGLRDDDPRVNPNGGAITLSHPLGMSGTRLVMTMMYQLQRMGGRYVLCMMCIGVGQGIALVIERV